MNKRSNSKERLDGIPTVSLEQTIEMLKQVFSSGGLSSSDTHEKKDILRSMGDTSTDAGSRSGVRAEKFTSAQKYGLLVQKKTIDPNYPSGFMYGLSKNGSSVLRGVKLSDLYREIVLTPVSSREIASEFDDRILNTGRVASIFEKRYTKSATRAMKNAKVFENNMLFAELLNKDTGRLTVDGGVTASKKRETRLADSTDTERIRISIQLEGEYVAVPVSGSFFMLASKHAQKLKNGEFAEMFKYIDDFLG